ncbi:MAG: hypothetical protein V4480_03240 [Patescibacteria group bacterium]
MSLPFTHASLRGAAHFPSGSTVIVFVAESEKGPRYKPEGHFFRARVLIIQEQGINVQFVKQVFDTAPRFDGHTKRYPIDIPFIMNQDEFDLIHTRPELREPWVNGFADRFISGRIEEFLAALDKPNDVGTFNQVFTV